MCDQSKERTDISYEMFVEKMLWGNEFDLTIHGIPFFIGTHAYNSDPQTIHTIQNMSTGDDWGYPSRQQLINDFRYNGKSLKQLWEDITILDII